VMQCEVEHRRHGEADRDHITPCCAEPRGGRVVQPARAGAIVAPDYDATEDVIPRDSRYAVAGNDR
jgi:hypothetical protein